MKYFLLSSLVCIVACHAAFTQDSVLVAYGYYFDMEGGLLCHIGEEKPMPTTIEDILQQHDDIFFVVDVDQTSHEHRIHPNVSIFRNSVKPYLISNSKELPLVVCLSKSRKQAIEMYQDSAIIQHQEAYYHTPLFSFFPAPLSDAPQRILADLGSLRLFVAMLAAEASDLDYTSGKKPAHAKTIELIATSTIQYLVECRSLELSLPFLETGLEEITLAAVASRPILSNRIGSPEYNLFLSQKNPEKWYKERVWRIALEALQGALTPQRFPASMMMNPSRQALVGFWTRSFEPLSATVPQPSDSLSAPSPWLEFGYTCYPTFRLAYRGADDSPQSLSEVMLLFESRIAKETVLEVFESASWGARNTNTYNHFATYNIRHAASGRAYPKTFPLMRMTAYSLSSHAAFFQINWQTWVWGGYSPHSHIPIPTHPSAWKLVELAAKYDTIYGIHYTEQVEQSLTDFYAFPICSDDSDYHHFSAEKNYGILYYKLYFMYDILYYIAFKKHSSSIK